MNTLVIAYVPVIHEGYVRFMRELPDDALIALCGPDSMRRFPWIKKDIRAVAPGSAARMLSLVFAREVCVLTEEVVEEARASRARIIAPDEEEVRHLADSLFPESEREFRSVFLRWDRKKVLSAEDVDAPVATDLTVHGAFMERARMAASGSYDWWLQVGAVLVPVSGDPLIARNEHVPDPRMPYILGDPRSFFSAGVHADLSTAEHAEARLVGEAARHGISLAGASMYVTVFPCPRCAKLIARAGISRLYFQGGFSSLRGADDLRAVGVELYRIQQTPP
jgi:dCMP deaminase